MEKYSQYRDRGSGIAPFFPIPPQPSGIRLPFYAFVFVLRAALLLATSITYFLFLSWLPIGSFLRKAFLWALLGIPGVWWVDLQIDGVRRGSLAQHHKTRLPHQGTVIASSFTSPIDCLYLAAVFDPIFTASYPNTRLVQHISLFRAILRALQAPQPSPPSSANLTELSTLIRKHPQRCVVVLPECTTTNGRGILPFSPSLLGAPPKTKIFPISLRYTPADITTPIPGTHLTFLWNLCSRPTHCIRVRIAEAVYHTFSSAAATGSTGSGANRPQPPRLKNSWDANFFDTLQRGEQSSSSDTLVSTGSNRDGELNAEERRLLDRIGEDLARLGRSKRVGLGVREKEDFVRDWTKKRR